MELVSTATSIMAFNASGLSGAATGDELARIEAEVCLRSSLVAIRHSDRY